MPSRFPFFPGGGQHAFNPEFGRCGRVGGAGGLRLHNHGDIELDHRVVDGGNHDQHIDRHEHGAGDDDLDRHLHCRTVGVHSDDHFNDYNVRLEDWALNPSPTSAARPSRAGGAPFSPRHE
jgi:hypothetical protein